MLALVSGRAWPQFLAFRDVPGLTAPNFSEMPKIYFQSGME
jgi:hypothetical protein